jgi:hypothetical protein
MEAPLASLGANDQVASFTTDQVELGRTNISFKKKGSRFEQNLSVLTNKFRKTLFFACWYGGATGTRHFDASRFSQVVAVAGEVEEAGDVVSGRRMELGLEDYPGSGANDRHSRWWQQRRN